MEVKISLKYSLILYILTALIISTYNLIFNVQHIEQFGVFHQIFGIYTSSVIYVIILFFAYKEVINKYESDFYRILIVSILIILFEYLIKYFSDWVFHYLNEFLNKPAKNTTHQTGILGLLNEFGGFFQKPQFNLLNYLHSIFVWPFVLLFETLYNSRWLLFWDALFTSKLFLTTFMIYTFSLFHLFQKFNIKGINSFIPIKNTLVLLNISNKPTWWIVPIYFPFVRWIIKYLINKEIAKKFNCSTSFPIGMTFLPWFFYGKLVFEKEKLG